LIVFEGQRCVFAYKQDMQTCNGFLLGTYNIEASVICLAYNLVQILLEMDGEKPLHKSAWEGGLVLVMIAANTLVVCAQKCKFPRH
jgi:hypothetical protein